MEEELLSAGLNEFAISGYMEGKKYLPWQMFDKSRYMLVKRKKYQNNFDIILKLSSIKYLDFSV